MDFPEGEKGLDRETTGSFVEIAGRSKGTPSTNRETARAVVFNIQRYSIQDGPGIRTIVFLKGCPLRCQWCCNPESQAPFPEVAHSSSLCKRCGECVEVCPTRAISAADEGNWIERKLCNNCGRCVDVCYRGAMRVYGKEMTINEVMLEVRRDASYYAHSGGGTTVSGGEPLTQPGFVLPFLKLSHELGWNTAVETCGHVNPRVLERVLPLADLMLFDIKHMDASEHKRLTGVSNELILTNMRRAARSGTKVIARVPVIPGINDSVENIAALVSFVNSLKTVREVNLLPYHRFGVGKYDMLDRKYSLGAIPAAMLSRLEEIRKIIADSGLHCEIIE